MDPLLSEMPLNLVMGLRRSLPMLSLAVGLASCAVHTPLAWTPQHAGQAPRPQVDSAKLATLWPQFVRQETPSSCSVASAQAVVNAILSTHGRPTLSSAEVLASDRRGIWAEHTADAHSSGLSLEGLALHMLQLLSKSGLRRVAVDVVQVRDTQAETRANLCAVLRRGEAEAGNYFVIANFLQSKVTPDGDPVGHFSPLGAYLAARDAVLMLDVDPEVPSPYWVPVADLLAAMATRSGETDSPRGYLVVRL